MRAVSHLFIARSRAAIFWFFVTVGSIVGSALYVQSVIADVRTLPQYVMAGSPDLYYLSPTLETENANQMHTAQTRLAMETIFNRNPSGLDHQDRRFKIFAPEANQQVTRSIILPQVMTFQDFQFHQKVEIEKVVVNIQEGMAVATTVANAQLLRTGLVDNQVVNEIWSATVFFTWTRNPSPRDEGMYPTVCTSVTFFKMERTSS